MILETGLIGIYLAERQGFNDLFLQDLVITSESPTSAFRVSVEYS